LSECQTEKNNETGTGCESADRAASAAVKKTFAILGVNIDEPCEVRDFQESLRFGDKLRKAADKGFLFVVAAVVVLTVVALITDAKIKLGVG